MPYYCTVTTFKYWKLKLVAFAYIQMSETEVGFFALNKNKRADWMRATGCGCGFWFWFWSLQQAALTEWLLLSVSAGALSSMFLRGPQYLLACCGGSSPPPVFSSECFLPHQRSLSEASAPLSAGAAALSCSPQLILRSALHGSIHNHSRLFRTGKRGGLLFKSPWRTPPLPPAHPATLCFVRADADF